MDLENRIQKYNSILTQNDRKVLRYILSNKLAAIHQSITEISKEIKISPASISRLCRKLQFENFQQMKYSLAKTDSSVKENQDTPDIILNYYETIIKSTKQFLSKEQITRLTSTLSETRSVLFCGMGNSGLIAKEFSSRTERMGINSQSVTESHAMLIKSTLLNNLDTLVCFSYTGRTQSVIDSARIAKGNGSRVIVITNYEETELTTIADEVVLISSHIYMEDEKFINTQIASLFLLDVLTYKLLENGKHMKNRNKTLESIERFG